MAKLKWGILSTANIGIKRVLPAILASSRGELLAIASREAAKAESVAGRFGIPRHYGDYQSLLDDPDVEAIYNPLPNHLHVEWTVKALQAGKHVLCEKPIALNAREASAIVAARDASGKKVLEAFMVRWHPQWRKAREWVRAGRISSVNLIQSAFLFTMRDPNNVRNQADIGGGALYDVGCYPIVTARYIFGEEPSRAVALIDRDPSMGVDRLTSGLVAFPQGKQLAFCSALQLASYQRVTLLGSEGRIEITTPFTPAHDQTCQLIVDSGKAIDGSSAVIETLTGINQYELQCDNAVSVFRGETEQEFPIEDAVSTMRVIDALYRSAGTGCWENV